MATITVTNSNDSGAGSLRAALANALSGDTIVFSPSVTDINLASSLVISKNVTIDGLLPGSTNPDVTINGGGANSNFADFTINAGVTATLEGLIIANGHATGVTGTQGTSSGGHYRSVAGAGGTGGGAAGGIYDAGALTLANSLLFNDTATGGTGGAGYTAVVNKLGPSQYSTVLGSGGGAGGNAAGAIYVAQTGTLTFSTSDSFVDDSAIGGTGGRGGGGSTNNPSAHGGGLGGTGVSATTGTPSAGNAGQNGYSSSGGAGGAAGLPGTSSGPPTIIASGGNNIPYLAPSGGGGGGTAFAEVGGTGTINVLSGVVTNNSDDVNTIGSLRYELAHIVAGGTVSFDPSVTTINLSSSLVISKNVTIEGASSAVTGAPGVTINGGGSTSNFADFTINAGVSATIDGLIIANGHAKGAAGATGTSSRSHSYTTYGAGGTGGAGAGGIYDAGALTLTNSVLQNDTAIGGAGGHGYNGVLLHIRHGTSDYFRLYAASGGGGGGSAAGSVYVARGASLSLTSSDSFHNNSATGGAGGAGGRNERGNGNSVGGAGGYAVSGNVSSGLPGKDGYSGPQGSYGGHGGAPGQPGTSGYATPITGHNAGYGSNSAGSGGGGNAFGDVGGKGTVNTLTDVVTNSSDNVNTVGSLRYELAHARPGDTITFDRSVTFIDLGSTLVISKNVTIEGSQTGSTPGVFIIGSGSFTDFTINVGVTANFDGLLIEDGHGAGAAGAYGASGGGTGGKGQGAGGAIYDAGTLTLTDSFLTNNTATGGAGGTGGLYNGGGGAGGNAAGGIYVASTGTLNYTTGDRFANNSATGGAGGHGASTNDATYSNIVGNGYGGAGGHSGVNGGVGQPGHAGSNDYLPSNLWGAGGAPGQPGGYGHAGGGGGGGSAFAKIGGAGTINQTPCYCPGTLIKTPRGEQPVETLEIGDEVMTASSVARPIKWIGRRSYAGRFVLGRRDILPVCIKAGALDDNLPRRDLWISPHHAMYLGGVLIEAKDLVNGVSIVQAECAEKIDYFHIELDSHDVIVAEGALAETYLDDDNRLMFHNAPDYYARYRDAAGVPAHYCAPRLDDGYEVEAVRQRLALRTGLLHADKATGTLRGYVDEVTAKRIAGWAQGAEHPDAPACLDIFADGEMIGQVLANEFREDLRRAGIGSGHHAFTFVPPQDIALARIEVRRSRDGALLARGPNAAAFVKVHRRAKRA